MFKISDEEIKAIEEVKKVIRIDKERRIVTLYDEKPLFRDQLQIIIDLLNKQQEKIVDLETKLEIEKIDNKYNQEERNEETIPRYKIRNKIKELETLYDCNLDTALTSYEMFVFVRSYIDKVKNCLNVLLKGD